MARWEPDARGRLEKAAMALFEERGYAQTTVSEIAARAGLTERTFFRYFSDKREVLFSGSKELEKTIVERIAQAPCEQRPLEVVTSALEAAGAELQASREPDYVRARYALVSKHAEIQERELIKLASLAAAVAQALHARGVAEPAASLTAEAGMAVFKVGFERWVNELKPSGTPGVARGLDFAAHIRAALEALKAIAGDGKGSAGHAKKKRAGRGVAARAERGRSKRDHATPARAAQPTK